MAEPLCDEYELLAIPRTCRELLRAKRRGQRLTADQQATLYERSAAIAQGWCEDCGAWTRGPHGVAECPAFRREA